MLNWPRMPELPEVETIRRQMERALKGKRVEGVEVRFSGRLLGVSKAAFEKAARGARFIGFGRRAKLLLLHLSNDRTIVAHLKMTGRFLLAGADGKPGKHVHAVFSLSDGKKLLWEDVRKFGYLKLFRTGELDEKLFAKEGYGPEPLDPKFTFRKFKMCLTAHPNKKVKPLLMEQACIAGIGNIYAEEALWEAKVHPARKAGDLSDAELRGIYRGALKTLRASIARRGTSADMYLDLYGRKGENVPNLKAYGREGEPCRRCRTPIEKIRVAGRGTHFCPRCQKKGA